MHRVDDMPTNYPNSKTPVNNVDYNYLCQILIDEAIGYSRNTIAVKTLEEVVQKIGSNKVIQYLKDINLFDNEDDVLNYAYALGGFKYGVSPVYLASAYSMLASKGIYREPLAVNKIELLDGSNQVFEFSNNERKILDEDSCYLLINVLESVMKKNFWNINQVKPNDVNVVAKTGTSSFDDSIISKYNYPKNAYKDRWLAGFSTNLSISVWTGFDNTLEDEKTYFTPSSNDANVTKKFFRRIMDVAGHKNETFEKHLEYLSEDGDLLGVKVMKPKVDIKVSNDDKKSNWQVFEKGTLSTPDAWQDADAFFAIPKAQFIELTNGFKLKSDGPKQSVTVVNPYASEWLLKDWNIIKGDVD